MRLNKGQDELMNNAIHNLGMINDGKDTVTGGPLSRQDMQRLAKDAMEALGFLWDQIGQGQPSLGYEPCPWGKNHVVMPLPGYHGECVACTHTLCPLYRVPIKRLDWNNRG